MSVEDQIRAEEALGFELVQYAGKWVAVQDHKVVASEETLRTLVDRLNGQRDTAEIFRVREDPTTPCHY
jgi:hypothetical protein